MQGSGGPAVSALGLHAVVSGSNHLLTSGLDLFQVDPVNSTTICKWSSLISIPQTDISLFFSTYTTYTLPSTSTKKHFKQAEKILQ